MTRRFSLHVAQIGCVQNFFLLTQDFRNAGGMSKLKYYWHISRVKDTLYAFTMKEGNLVGQRTLYDIYN